MKDLSNLIKKFKQDMVSGDLPPWKAESAFLDNGVKPPDHFYPAALARMAFIEDISGEKFSHLKVLEKPYLQPWQCPKDDIIYNLEAQEKDLSCTVCRSDLVPYKGPLADYAPLVASYVAGLEDYVSYCGRVIVRGDINKDFINLTSTGPGMTAIGLTRGSFLVNRYGGAEVKVEPVARTARCLGYIFNDHAERNRAQDLIRINLDKITASINKHAAKVGATVYHMEFETDSFGHDFFLYICFYGQAIEYRAHGEFSWSVGAAREMINDMLNKADIAFNLSITAMAYDGDYKPSLENKRGRQANARLRVPVKEMEKLIEKPLDRLLAFIEMDRRGIEKLGWLSYSRMGPEIISGLYKATRVNPRMPFITSLERIQAFVERDEFIFSVDLPNVECGVWSSIEGGIPPTGREVLRIMGITNAREFAANLAAQVLAAEFNLICELVRGKLYATKVNRLY
jgi:hypothetical protein